MNSRFERSVGCLVLSLFVGIGAVADEFPESPDERLTPGSKCERPDQIRYPERIKYCERNVSSEEKWQIIRSYQALGFEIPNEKRADYKIDHLIPLCAGGSNSHRNLWPQHKSVYQKTDRLEAILCEKMAKGELRQDEAIDLILRAKAEPDRAAEISRSISNRP
jgi:hypothetical protein